MNAFDALCELASAEGWCWRYPCSTCANMEFRYGFLELARGKHPQDQNWIMTRDDIVNGKVYEFPYEFPFKYPLEDRKSVIKICLDSNLAVINDLCSFPDWLGYLGLVLIYMRPLGGRPFPLFDKVSQHWAKQLKEMLSISSAAHKRLDLIINNDGYRLDLSDLKACEKALNGDEAKERKKKEENRKYNESIAYESLIEIINNPGRPYSSDVAIYARQEDVDRLTDGEYEKLCKMYTHLSINANTPWAKFKEKYLTGRS